MLIADIGREIDAGCATRPAPDNTRDHQPEAAPSAVGVDGVERILRARRPMPALIARERFQGPAVEVDGEFEEFLQGLQSSCLSDRV